MTGPFAFLRPDACPLAANFTFHNFTSFGHSTGHNVAQIKISLQALSALANKREHRFRMLNIDFVFQSTRPGQTVRFEIAQLNHQRFQLRKFFSEAGGLVDTLNLTQAVFRPWIRSPRRHHIHWLSSAHEEKATCEAPAKSWSKSNRL